MSSDDFSSIFRVQNEKTDEKVAQQYPAWIRNSIIFNNQNEVDVTEFENVLDDKSLKYLEKKNFEKLLAVQAAVIPSILDNTNDEVDYYMNQFIPSDILVSSPTGSGKTLTFLMPIMQILNLKDVEDSVNSIRCIILTPTQLLGNQIFKVCKELCEFYSLEVQHSITSKNVDENIKYIINNRIDILITTPARLADLIENGIPLKYLQFLVIDEIDKVLKESSESHWMEIFDGKSSSGSLSQKYMYKGISIKEMKSFNRETHCRKLFFSATMTKDAEKLSSFKLVRPILFETKTSPKQKEIVQQHNLVLPPNLKEFYTLTPSIKLRPLTLIEMIKSFERPAKVLVFVEKNLYVNNLKELLLTHSYFTKDDVHLSSIDGQLSNYKKKQVMTKYNSEMKGNNLMILLCTDVVSRGIDVDNISHIVSYAIPDDHNCYVHRVGRTARSTNDGKSFTILYKKDFQAFWMITNRMTRSSKIKPYPMILKDDEKKEFKTILHKFENKKK
ncbi:hypothetical protein SNEBB_001061 [Seison nebaliae]|nr:hypothetical protein SNEBB_001061 [Seison nebaliae]